MRQYVLAATGESYTGSLLSSDHYTGPTPL
jgi:hypothetical protein